MRTITADGRRPSAAICVKRHGFAAGAATPLRTGRRRPRADTRSRSRSAAVAPEPAPSPRRRRSPSDPNRTPAPARPRPRAPRPARADLGAQRQRRRLQVVDHQPGGPSAAPAPEPRSSARRPQLAASRAPARAGRPRGTRRRSRARRAAAPRQRVGGQLGQRAHDDRRRRSRATRPGRAGSARRTRARRRSRRARRPVTGPSARRRAQHRGGVRRPTAHAGGHRDPLVDLDAQRRRPPTRRPQRRERRGDQVRSRTPGQTTSSWPRPAASTTQVIGEPHRLEQRHQLVPAVGPGPPSSRHRLTLANARVVDHVIARCRRASSRNSPATRRSARSSAGWPSSTSAARARSRTSGPQSPGASASEPASALRRWANAPWTSAAAAGRRRARAPQPEQHRVDVGDRAGTRCATIGRSTLTSEASWASTDGHPVGRRAGRGGEPLADLALDHHHPLAHLGQLLERPQDHRGGDPVREVGHDLVRAPGAGRPDRAPARRPCAGVTLPNGASASRSGPRSRSSTSTTCRCDTRAAARYSDSTPGPPPISSTTSLSCEVGQARDHAEDVAVDQEVLAQLALAARRARRSPSEHGGRAGLDLAARARRRERGA